MIYGHICLFIYLFIYLFSHRHGKGHVSTFPAFIGGGRPQVPLLTLLHTIFIWRWRISSFILLAPIDMPKLWLNLISFYIKRWMILISNYLFISHSLFVWLINFIIIFNSYIRTLFTLFKFDNRSWKKLNVCYNIKCPGYLLTLSLNYF